MNSEESETDLRRKKRKALNLERGHKITFLYFTNIYTLLIETTRTQLTHDNRMGGGTETRIRLCDMDHNLGLVSEGGTGSRVRIETGNKQEKKNTGGLLLLSFMSDKLHKNIRQTQEMSSSVRS